MWPRERNGPDTVDILDRAKTLGKVWARRKIPAESQPWGGNIAPTRLSYQYPPENSLAADLSMSPLTYHRRRDCPGASPGRALGRSHGVGSRSTAFLLRSRLRSRLRPPSKGPQHEGHV